MARKFASIPGLTNAAPGSRYASPQRRLQIASAHNPRRAVNGITFFPPEIVTVSSKTA
jgi:hypothetical protein